MRFVGGVTAIVCLIEEWVALVALAVLSASIFAGVIFRYVINQPLAWTNEIAMLSFVWLVFAASSIGVRNRTHLGIDYFFLMFPWKVRKIVDILIFIAIAAGVVLLIKLGYDQTLSVARTRTPILRISWSYVYVAVPIFGTFMLFHALKRVGDNLMFWMWKP